MFVATLIDNGTKADILDLVVWAFVIIIILSVMGYIISKMKK